jgi:hypothetical protein
LSVLRFRDYEQALDSDNKEALLKVLYILKYIYFKNIGALGENVIAVVKIGSQDCKWFGEELRVKQGLILGERIVSDGTVKLFYT